MLYLSRVILNPRSKAVRSDLADCHRLHCTIMAAFPQAVGDGGSAREHFGVLYRVEADGSGRRVVLLVQSRAEPNWSRLPEGYALDTGGDVRNPDWKRVDEHYERIQAGMQLTFRLRANPTKRIGTADGLDAERWKGKRVDLRREEDQIAWLRRKAADGGFELLEVRTNALVPLGEHDERRYVLQRDVLVPDARASAVTTVTGRKTTSEESRTARSSLQLSFGSVIFEGLLRVVDSDQFQRTMELGIGSGKAYGFGLLSIARPAI